MKNFLYPNRQNHDFNKITKIINTYNLINLIKIMVQTIISSSEKCKLNLQMIKSRGENLRANCERKYLAGKIFPQVVNDNISRRKSSRKLWTIISRGESPPANCKRQNLAAQVFTQIVNNKISQHLSRIFLIRIINIYIH